MTDVERIKKLYLDVVDMGKTGLIVPRTIEVHGHCPKQFINVMSIVRDFTLPLRELFTDDFVSELEYWQPYMPVLPTIIDQPNTPYPQATDYLIEWVRVDGVHIAQRTGWKPSGDDETRVVVGLHCTHCNGFERAETKTVLPDVLALFKAIQATAHEATSCHRTTCDHMIRRTVLYQRPPWTVRDAAKDSI